MNGAYVASPWESSEPRRDEPGPSDPEPVTPRKKPDHRRGHRWTVALGVVAVVGIVVVAGVAVYAQRSILHTARAQLAACQLGLVGARDRLSVHLDAGLRPPAASRTPRRRSDKGASPCPFGDRVQGKRHLSGSPGVRLGHGHQIRLRAVPKARGGLRRCRPCPRRRRNVFDGGLCSRGGTRRPGVWERHRHRPWPDWHHRPPDRGGNVPRQPPLAVEPGQTRTGSSRRCFVSSDGSAEGRWTILDGQWRRPSTASARCDCVHLSLALHRPTLWSTG